MTLDLFFADIIYKRNKLGFICPIDEETGEAIPSQSRLEILQLYHGVKSESAWNEVLASFPSQIVGQLTCLKDLTILSFLDDAKYSQELIERIPNV